MSNDTPKEYWLELGTIDKHSLYTADVYEYPVDGINEDAVHVIEYSAYEQLKSELEAKDAEIALLKVSREQYKLDSMSKFDEIGHLTDENTKKDARIAELEIKNTDWESDYIQESKIAAKFVRKYADAKEKIASLTAENNELKLEISELNIEKTCAGRGNNLRLKKMSKEAMTLESMEIRLSEVLTPTIPESETK